MLHLPGPSRRPVSQRHPIRGLLVLVINSCPVTRMPPAGTDGVRISPVRAGTRTRISGKRLPGVFGAVGSREDLAATGRIRELSLDGRAGPARRYVFAYILSHRV